MSEPYLLDTVIAELQQGLKDNLPWLDYAFGRAQRTSKEINGRPYIFPSCFSGGIEYTDVSPSGSLGNFSFVHVEEPQEVEWQHSQLPSVTVPISLIFWYDFRRMDSVWQVERNTEAVKNDILKALSVGIYLRAGRLTLHKIYEQAENIYSDYPGVRELDNQFLMHPYGGIRIEGEIKLWAQCKSI